MKDKKLLELVSLSEQSQLSDVAMWNEGEDQHLVALVKNLEDLHPSHKAKFELYLFETMKWGHFITFFFQIIMLAAKQH